MMTDSETARTRHLGDESDEDASEAQAQIIASLRSQVTDLFSQVTQLNSKLVSSYDRVSDLEDQLHDTSASLRNASVTISSLELERSHHLAALNTGLLVEKAHVTTELTRLMERATEEAAQRGQAESARRDIEKDLDDLSATLFDQANTMVAEARFNQASSERKVQDAEEALKIAEDAVKDMQVQMQSLQAAKEAAERDARDTRLTMGKGKWVERDDLHVGDVPMIRFMTTHTPYAEFIAFVAHLRGLRVSQPAPPVISTLLTQPFIARLLTEDSEPTVRLDLAPSLNWLSRRSVLSAIHAGMLTVEPLPFSSFVQEQHQHPQSMSSATLSCALCGTFITRLPFATSIRSNNTNGSWFKFGNAQNRDAGTPSAGTPVECEPPGQIYIFRLAPNASTPPALPPMHTSSASMPSIGTSSRLPLSTGSSSRVLASQTQNSPYPLCTSNYCLTRLRSTCSLWAFVRVGIVERIWDEEVVQPSKFYDNGDTPQVSSPQTGQPTSGNAPPSTYDKPLVPPRRKRLWEMASALGERAVSWGKEGGETTKEKEKEGNKEDSSAKRTFLPPPSHPSVLRPHAESPTSRVVAPGPPPPLPKRNIVRDRAKTDVADVPSGTQSGTVALELNESATDTNGHIQSEKVDLNPSSPIASDSPSSPIEDITFATPPSPPSSTASHTVPSEITQPSVPAVDDQVPPSSPYNVPLPTTPTTPIPAPRTMSPIPRPRSRVSSPASPPPSSRPASPASSRSRAGSPTPMGTGIARPSPAPGLPPSVTHIRGKTSIPSPLASSRPASPAPPVPRRAPARRTVPPPPLAPSDAKSAGEAGKGEVVPPQIATVAAAVDPTAEVNFPEPGEAGGSAQTKISDEKGDGERGNEVAEQNSVCQVTPGSSKDATIGDVNDMPVPATTTEATPGSAKDVNDVVAGDAEREANHVSVPGPTTDASKDAMASDAEEQVKDLYTPAAITDTAPGPVTTGDAEERENYTSTPLASDPCPPFASGENVRTSLDTTSTKQSSSSEGEGFAGDATWEERTWKELVRLKEEMFWARMGGVRAVRGQ